jgi:pyridoxine 4-dehydrogenase
MTLATSDLDQMAYAAGSFPIGGETPVYRLGFGAMRITGRGIWGPPANRDEAIRTLRRVPELGITFIDTADSYGPGVSEDLIREALHPYKDLVIATKAGLVRPGPDQWTPCGKPEYLRKQVVRSLQRLGVERIELWQLHRIDPGVPRDEQFACIANMQREGLIHHVGLSEVSVEDVKAAESHFKVATVQNLYNVTMRRSEALLTYCTERQIGFIPWYPLGAGALTAQTALARVAERHDATAGQIALAWLLRRSPVMLPIPGTGKVAHLEENTRAAAIELSSEDMETLNALGRGPDAPLSQPEAARAQSKV